MDTSSKIAQKLIGLLLFTVALVVPNELFSDRFVSAQTDATALVGKAAPDFSLKDTAGKTWNLKDQKGKVIVLEWFNHGCPFVKKHYDSGNMQKLQKEYTGKGVVWVSINSSAPGKQGYAEGAAHAAVFKEKKAAPSVVLVDSDGTVGHLYGAKTTPDMYVIDKSGKLVYSGAIDSKSTFDAGDIPSSENYVKKALDEVLGGKTVTTTNTKPYGCSVKYKG